MKCSTPILLTSLLFLTSCGGSNSSSEPDPQPTNTGNPSSGSGTTGNTGSTGGSTTGNNPEPCVVSDSVNAGLGISDVVMADANDDSLPDMLIIYDSLTEFGITWRENLGNGKFANEVVIESGKEEKLFTVTVGQMDGLNGTDIVAVTRDAIYKYEDLGDSAFTCGKSLTASWEGITKVEDSSTPQNGAYGLDSVILPNKSRYSDTNEVRITDVNNDGLSDIYWVSHVHTANIDHRTANLLYLSMNKDGLALEQPALLDHVSGGMYSDDFIEIVGFIDFNRNSVKELVYIQDARGGTLYEEVRWISDTNLEHKKIGIGAPFNQHFDLFVIDWDLDNEFELLQSSIDEDGEATYLFDDIFDSTKETKLSLHVPNIKHFIDLDNDGFKDIVNYESAEVSWQKKVNTNVEPVGKLFDYRGTMKGVYDIDNDGYMDFVSYSTNSLFWYKNNGDATFVESVIAVSSPQ